MGYMSGWTYWGVYRGKSLRFDVFHLLFCEGILAVMQLLEIAMLKSMICN